MTAPTKTDNHDPAAKLCVRHYFLRKYHADGLTRVIDCCMGSGYLWRELRKTHNVKSYLGLDLKPKKGRLKIESARYLEAGGWDHNCIDIDTYGSPWRHWFGLLKHIEQETTVFLTIGMIRVGGGGGLIKLTPMPLTFVRFRRPWQLYLVQCGNDINLVESSSL